MSKNSLLVHRNHSVSLEILHHGHTMTSVYVFQNSSLCFVTLMKVFGQTVCSFCTKKGNFSSVCDPARIGDFAFNFSACMSHFVN